MVDFDIVPLSPENLKEALSLVLEVFEVYTEEDPNVWFPASIEPWKYKSLYEREKVRDCRYFVAIEKTSNKVIGTTGLYHLATEPEDVAQVGWYCVAQVYRGRGIGKKILEWTIKLAHNEGNSKLRLYTSTRRDLAAANAVYHKLGFRIIKTEDWEKHKLTYWELDL